MRVFNNYKEIEVSQLVKAPWNYKADDPEKLAKLTEAIKRSGQIENIIVRQLPTGFYEVVNGNHRVDCFLQLGITHAVVYDLGVISEASAIRVAIQTNETRFETNEIDLAKLMREISQEFGLEDLALTMPYSEEEIGAFVELPDLTFKQFSALPEPAVDVKRDAKQQTPLTPLGVEELEKEIVNCAMAAFESVISNNFGNVVSQLSFAIKQEIAQDATKRIIKHLSVKGML